VTFIDRFFQYETMDGNGRCPIYLHRWTLLKVGSLFSIYLHKFVGDDWSLDLHDHPKRFWSIGLFGQYVEHTPDRSKSPMLFCAPWFRTFPADHIHRLTGPTPEYPCWTLVIVGKAVRPWGFWSNGTFVPWKKYVDSDTATERKSCP
jgi:hypothetical protein